jgi:hypothetical protein
LTRPFRSPALLDPKRSASTYSFAPRSTRTILVLVMLGHGLSNKGILLRRGKGDIDVMAIDNAWLALFWETGLFGVGPVLLAVLATILAVCRAPTPYVRAAAGFLVTFVAITSFTETGLSDLSSQTLHILVAAGAAYADRLSVRGQRPMLLVLSRTKPRLVAEAGSFGSMR